MTYFNIFFSLVYIVCIISQILTFPPSQCVCVSVLLQTRRPCEGEPLAKYAHRLFTDWVYCTLQQQFGNKLRNSHEMMMVTLTQQEITLRRLISRKETFLNQTTTATGSRRHTYTFLATIRNFSLTIFVWLVSRWIYEWVYFSKQNPYLSERNWRSKPSP